MSALKQQHDEMEALFEVLAQARWVLSGRATDQNNAIGMLQGAVRDYDVVCMRASQKESEER